MWLKTLAARSFLPERMDDPALSADQFRLALDHIARVNRWTLGARPTLAFLDRAVGARSGFRLLDVGCGQGDMLRAIWKWARSRGIAAELVGVDRDARSRAAARTATPRPMNIRFVTGDYEEVRGPFDCVVSNLVAHHMNERDLQRFVAFMEGAALRGWMINDLHRRRSAQALYATLAPLLRVHPIVVGDGILSVARSFRRDDWRRILEGSGLGPDDARVIRYFPFRLCVERLV